MADGKRCPRGACGLIITVLAVGKAAGPERELCARYVDRARKAGRAIGLSRVDTHEVADAAGPTRREKEGAALLQKRPKGLLVALDESGAQWSSKAFAEHLRNWADNAQDVCFAIGGADGHAQNVRSAADHIMSLGAMTLPHGLARVILCEQIYRAITLCIGHPYHRA